MYIYEQRTGAFYDGDLLIAVGYSGFGPHRNNPDSEKLAGLGPIPRGVYWIGPEEDSSTKGPVMMRLVPVAAPPEAIRTAVPGAEGTQTWGRDAFELHGDSKEHPGAASHGCIVLARPIRERVADGRDRLLVVVSGDRRKAAA